MDDEITRDFLIKFRQLLRAMFLSGDHPGVEKAIEEVTNDLVAGIKNGLVTAYVNGYRAGLAERDSIRSAPLH